MHIKHAILQNCTKCIISLKYYFNYYTFVLGNAHNLQYSICDDEKL